MTALAQAISRFSISARFETETLKWLALFCGAVVFALVARASYGLDLSAGFF